MKEILFTFLGVFVGMGIAKISKYWKGRKYYYVIPTNMFPGEVIKKIKEKKRKWK